LFLFKTKKPFVLGNKPFKKLLSSQKHVWYKK
jgi:hypothetical protein